MELPTQVEVAYQFIKSEYDKELARKTFNKSPRLVIDFLKLAEFNPEIAEQLLDEPEEVMKSFQQATAEATDNVIKKIRIRNLPDSCKIDIGDLRNKQINKLLVIEGLIKQKSMVKPTITETRFECPNCGSVILVLQQDDKHFKEPQRCLPKGTKVHTPNGLTPIEKCNRVLCVDYHGNLIESEATIFSMGTQEIYRINDAIDCSKDHLWFVMRKGKCVFLSTNKLVVGDKLLKIYGSEGEHDLYNLSKRISTRDKNLQAKRSRRKQNASFGKQNLFSEMQAKASRIMSKRFLSKTSKCGYCSRDVPKSEIINQGHSSSASRKQETNISKVERKKGSVKNFAGTNKNRHLVRENRAPRRSGQRELQAWKEMWRNILSETDEGFGFEQMSLLFDRTRLSSSSQRLKSSKSSLDESSSALQFVPYEITRIDKIRERVEMYDLKVPNYNNFILENNILTHNCNCGRKGSFRVLSHNKIDVCSLLIEEPAEQASSVKLSQINILLKEDLTEPKIDHLMAPGIRIQITGILKAFQLDKAGVKSNKMDWYLDANYIDVKEESYANIKWDEDDVNKFKELAANPECLELIRRNIFKDVYGYREETEGVVLQMFGGVNIHRGGANNRGNIHVLLVGDPGSCKSTILKIAQKFSPKAIYVAGTGVSGVGITASVVKNEFIGGYDLAAGPLIMANGGLVCIDELDKMADEHKESLHEPLEQQCYHPDTEIILSDGKRIKIGELVEQFVNEEDGVDELKIIGTHNLQGINAPVQTNFLYRKKYKGPLYNITFGNGRSMKVTRNHPVFVFDKNASRFIGLRPACEIKSNDYVPALKYLSFIENDKPLVFKGRKLNLERLARFLGFFAAEGHTYYGAHNNSHQVGVSTTDKSYRDEMVSIIKDLFGIIPVVTTNWAENDPLRKKDKYDISICKKEFYEWFIRTFPLIAKKSGTKRAPDEIFVKKEMMLPFLKGAFDGDGTYKTSRYSIATASEGLASDYQDLLLCLSIRSNLHKDKKYFKLDVLAEDELKFTALLDKPTKLKADKIIPGDIYAHIAKLYSRSGLINSGTLIPKFYGIGQTRINEACVEIRKKCEQVLNSLSYVNTMDDLLRITDLSMMKIGLLCGKSAGYVGMFVKDENHRLIRLNKKIAFIKHCKEVLKKEYSDLWKQIHDLEKNIDVFNWIRVKDISMEEYDGFVYDVNVPEHTFISLNGLLLHNTVSISKAGITATLPSNTSVLTAANPEYGTYSEFDSIYSQIDLSPTLINRFDLVYPIKESELTKEDDYAIAMKILSRSDKEETPEYDRAFIRAYIAYSKTIKPLISKELQAKMSGLYARIKDKKRQNKESSSIPVTARCIDGFRRLVESLARVRLRKEASEEDVMLAYNKLIYSLKQLGIDPSTGEVAEMTISDGEGQRTIRFSPKDVTAKIMSFIRDQSRDKNGAAYIEDIIRVVGVEEFVVEEKLMKLKSQGDIFEPRHGFFRISG